MRPLRLMLRLLLVQALWNYRTLLGAGMAWVLLPRLREIAGGDEARLRELVQRQAEHFNAHPYLCGFAAGALARMEANGEPPGDIQRFRDVLRGPLGSLGDGLVWAAWLPTCVLAAGGIGLLGVPPLLAVAAFLVAYNSLHLPLRWWGAAAGLALGRGVGEALRRFDLRAWRERVGTVGVLLLGLMGGLSLAILGERAAGTVPAAGLAACAGGTLTLFVVGFLRGRSNWWWTPALLPIAVASLLLAGAAG